MGGRVRIYRGSGGVENLLGRGNATEPVHFMNDKHKPQRGVHVRGLIAFESALACMFACLQRHGEGSGPVHRTGESLPIVCV